MHLDEIKDMEEGTPIEICIYNDKIHREPYWIKGNFITLRTKPNQALVEFFFNGKRVRRWKVLGLIRRIGDGKEESLAQQGSEEKGKSN